MEAAVYEELKEVKEELEQVKKEYKKKTELHQRLKRAHDDQIIKLQESKLQIDRQWEEISGKSSEICEGQRVCEDLKSHLVEKDLILGKLSSANDKMRVGWEEKVNILEGSNRELVLALDDMMGQKKILEDKLCKKREESGGLKALLSVTESKCSEVEKKAHMSMELSRKDELIARLEDEARNVQDQLKWKNEQFSHLEDAHEKLHSKFRLSKLEWEKERLVLVDKISSLLSSLDSQTRISSRLQTKLKMCNQALAYEESRRKLIEIQLSESQVHFESIYATCQEEQAIIDRLTAKRDEQVANLRELLATKEILFKEMEFKILELNQQKEDIHVSLKEFQEAEIKHSGSVTTLRKLQKKLRNLELVHGSCFINLERKENEWTSQLERLKAEAKEYLSELKNKETQINELHKELEMCQFSLQVFNEEMATVIMVLKSEYSEAYSKLLGEHQNKEHKESSVSIPESKATYLVAQHQILLLEKDLEDHRKMIEESQRKQAQLEEHVLEIEKTYKAELVEETREINLINAELWKWKNEAEILKSSLEEAREISKQKESLLQLQLDNELASKQEINNLKNALKERERNYCALEQQINSLEATMTLKDDTLRVLELKNKNHTGIIEELEANDMHLRENISSLEMHRDSILDEIEEFSNQLLEICCKDEILLAAFRNTEYTLSSELSNNDENYEAISVSPSATKLVMIANERLPFQPINY